MRKIRKTFLLAAVISISATVVAQNKTGAPAAEAGIVSKPKSPSNATSGKPTGTNLPVRRVTLYKTGVGYFEHLGTIRGDQKVLIDFTSNQLNDVLQSLTVLDLNGGRIAGVDYNSEAPLSQRLGMLRLPLEEKTDISKFYSALRGARLEVRSGATVITGRLLSVERKTRVSGGTTLEVDLATIVTDAGDVRSVEMTPAVIVRLAERDVTQQVGSYLSMLASERKEDLRRMAIAANGSGERQLYVSYISEVPVWKTTYRIVLPTEKQSETLLQGWAIVDNTVGEDWSKVELSLVAGAPQSFIEQLSQPYYARRPVVALPQNAQLTPQTHESAMIGGFGGLSGVVTDPSGAIIPGARIQLFSSANQMVDATTTDNQGRYEFHDLPAGNYRVEFTSNGFKKTAVNDVLLQSSRVETQNAALQVGDNGEMVMVTAAAPTVDTMSESESASAIRTGHAGSGRELGGGHGSGSGAGAGTGRNWNTGAGYPMAGEVGQAIRAMSADAEGSDLGDYFEYKLKDRVTIHKNESALVPVVQAQVTTEKVSLWNVSLGSPRPLRAIWLTNSSSLTLDGGSFSVLENDVFAGEGLTDAMKPGERRLLSYATDLGVRVEATPDSEPQHVTRVRVIHGAMIETSELRQDTTYTVRNDDTAWRSVLIEHPVRDGWAISGDGPKPEETTTRAYRFRQDVEPKSTAKITIRETKALETRFELDNLTDDQITLFLQQKSINADIESSFRKIVAQKDSIASLDAKIEQGENEAEKIYDDQQRLRENLKALKGSAEERALTLRYAKQLADQETRLETIQHESADLHEKRDQAQSYLDSMIEGLSFDATL